MKRRAYMIDKDCNRWTALVEEDATTTHVVERRNGASTAIYEMHKVVVDGYVVALVGVEKVGMGKVKPALLCRALFGDEAQLATPTDEPTP